MASVLIVDDVDINRMILSEILNDTYEIAEAENGVEAIDYLFNVAELPKAVLLDIMMPGMDGYQTLEMIRGNARTQHIPVLLITAADAKSNESKGIESGANDFITKPINPDVVRARVENHIALAQYRQSLEELLEKKTAELIAVHERTLETLATIIEYRSLESGAHVRRTCELTRILIGAMLRDDYFNKQLLKQFPNSIINAVALHDIGKIGIPDNILLKPGRLTDEEFEVIKRHSTIGSEIIDAIAKDATDDRLYLKHCQDICRHHHERWDGNGYPDHIAGEAIPLAARILSVVDVYDALVNKRCYKPALSHEETLELIQKGSGTQFDPNVVRVMMTVADKFDEVRLSMGDSEEDIVTTALN